MGLIDLASAGLGLAALLVPAHVPATVTTGVPGEVASDGIAGVVIAEFAPSGPRGSTDEFIELHNTRDQTIALGGWDLSVCLRPSTSFVLVTFGSTNVIRAGGRFVLAHRDVFGQFPDLHYSVDVPDDGGWLLLRPSTWYSDGVGLSPGLACTEGDPASQCDWASGEAATRNQQGRDTDDNSADFTCKARTPGG